LRHRPAFEALLHSRVRCSTPPLPVASRPLLSWASQPGASHPPFLAHDLDKPSRVCCCQPKLAVVLRAAEAVSPVSTLQRGWNLAASLPNPPRWSGLRCSLCDIVRLSWPPARPQPCCWLSAASALRALLRPHNVWASRPYDPTSCVVSTPLTPPCRKRPVNSAMCAHLAEASCPPIRGIARRRLLATLTSRHWPSSFQSSCGTPACSESPPCSLASFRICRRAARVTTGLATPHLPSARHRSGSSPAPSFRGISRATPPVRRPALWVPRQTRRP